MMSHPVRVLYNVKEAKVYLAGWAPVCGGPSASPPGTICCVESSRTNGTARGPRRMKNIVTVEGEKLPKTQQQSESSGSLRIVGSPTGHVFSSVINVVNCEITTNLFSQKIVQKYIIYHTIITMYHFYDCYQF